MEIVNVRKMIKNEIEEKELDFISRSFKKEIRLSFWGYTESNMTTNSNYELYFIPVMNGISDKDIFGYYKNTSYGFCKKSSQINKYIVDLDKISESCNFLDLFGVVYEYEIQENTVLDIETENGTIKLFDYEWQKEGTIFLGRFARVNRDFWKFHPMYKQTNSISSVKRNYISGDFINKSYFSQD